MPCSLSLADFLTELRARPRKVFPAELDAGRIIMVRVRLNPEAIESRILRKVSLAILAGKGRIAQADLDLLNHEALGLLDAFASDRANGRYDSDELGYLAKKLRAAVE